MMIKITADCTENLDPCAEIVLAGEFFLSLKEKGIDASLEILGELPERLSPEAFAVLMLKGDSDAE